MRPYFFHRRILVPLYRLRYRLFGPRPQKAYMCQVDYDHHLDGDSYGCKVFGDIEDLRKHKPCVSACGIVEVKIVRTKIVQPSKY